MDEDSLVAAIDTYKEQLSQVETAIAAAGEDQNGDLVTLREDLKQLIGLTEESLLSFKKSKLLSLLEGSQATDRPSRGNGSSTIQDNIQPAASDMDAEFAAFQAAITQDDETSRPNIDDTEHSPSTGKSHTDSDSEEQQDIEEAGGSFDDIVGTKCRAPFRHDWGTFQYHNCMILGVEDLENESEPKVRVMYCNPTHQTMVPCPFYLEDRCRFSDEDCRFSHGCVVDVSELKEFIDPDYSKLKLDTDCLAKDSDGVWYKATVIEVDEDGQNFQVMFEANHATATVDIADTIPFNEEDFSSGDSDNEGETSQPISEQNSDEEDALPVFLWRPSQTTSSMGEWEAHTKGVGSRLMAKMGYIMGQGLGKDGLGRAEPVPIQLLPSGKSLDKIMELKALAGDQDLYDVMKRQKRKQRKTDSKASKSYDNNSEKASLFDFINKKLGHKKGNIGIHALAKSSHQAKRNSNVEHISENDLTSRSDRHINVQVLKTHDEINKVKKEIVRLKDAVSRNENRDKTTAAQLQQKVQSMEKYLDQLKTSEKSLQTHKQSRKDHQKLTIF